MKKLLVFSALLLLPLGLKANELSIGSQYWGWNLSVIYPQSSNELFFPVSIAVQPVTHLTLYAQTELGIDFLPPYSSASINESSNSESALSDTTIGGKGFLLFQAGGDFFANVGFNLPSGNAIFRNNQFYLDGEFMDVHYQAVTFGISAMAGVDISDGNGEFTFEAGYMDPNVFNTTFGLPMGNSLYSQNCDTFIFSVSHSRTTDDGSTQTFGLWAFFHDPVSFSYQYGPSLDFDYRSQRAKGFSLDAGGQLFLNNRYRPVTFYGFPYLVVSYGPFEDESLISRGPRLYADPSYSFGQVTIQGQVHYLFANGYPISGFHYDGGGWLLGFGPLWKMPINGHSDITLSGSFTKIIQENAAEDVSGDRVDFLTDLWRFGIDYDLRF